MGGVLGAIGGFLMHKVAKSAENRVLIGEEYFKGRENLKK
jgi:hypothetical protein